MQVDDQNDVSGDDGATAADAAAAAAAAATSASATDGTNTADYNVESRPYCLR